MKKEVKEIFRLNKLVHRSCGHMDWWDSGLT